VARILVVEDNPVNLELVRDILEAHGHEVLEAANATDGLALLSGELPDLILMDIQLPGMDGLTATRQIKADARLQGIPVVALTAHAMKGDEERALAAGCDGYVSKPIDTRALPQMVAGFLVSPG
jgi:CheY-like chemotaxis protein